MRIGPWQGQRTSWTSHAIRRSTSSTVRSRCSPSTARRTSPRARRSRGCCWTTYRATGLDRYFVRHDDWPPFQREDFLLAHTAEYVDAFFAGWRLLCESNELTWSEQFARAKALPNCFLWMNYSSGPSPSDLSLYGDLAGCFETLADAVALVKQILDESEPEVQAEPHPLVSSHHFPRIKSHTAEMLLMTTIVKTTSTTPIKTVAALLIVGCHFLSHSSIRCSDSFRFFQSLNGWSLGAMISPMHSS